MVLKVFAFLFAEQRLLVQPNTEQHKMAPTCHSEGPRS